MSGPSTSRVAFTFANNEGWHDDVSDGPVTARVTLAGVDVPVDPAWVVVAPPNYAPMQKSVRTMWDVMRDTAIAGGMLVKPARPSFEHDIRPLFERMSQLQWVNAGFAAAFGWKAPNDFMRPELMELLASNTPDSRERRRTIANHFRVFDRDSWSPTPWPWLYGDAMNIPPAQTPRQHVSLTATQLGFAKKPANRQCPSDACAIPADGPESPQRCELKPVSKIVIVFPTARRLPSPVIVIAAYR